MMNLKVVLHYLENEFIKGKLSCLCWELLVMSNVALING